MRTVLESQKLRDHNPLSFPGNKYCPNACASDFCFSLFSFTNCLCIAQNSLGMLVFESFINVVILRVFLCFNFKFYCRVFIVGFYWNILSFGFVFCCDAGALRGRKKIRMS